MRALAGEREAGLLALLVARRGTSTRAEVLADELWDGRRVSDAALRVTVNRLRHRLPDSEDCLLRSEPRAYQLVAGTAAIDAGCFDDLAERIRDDHRRGSHTQVVALTEQAERLWRGEAYDGFTHLPSVRVDHDRLEGLRTSTLELRVASLLQLSRLSEALDAADQVLARQPLRESTVALRCIALARSGRTADAARSLAEFATMLDDELGGVVGPELDDLARRLDRGSEASSPLLTAPSTSLADVIGRTNAGTRARPLLGRDAELGELRHLATTDALRLVVLDGEAGIGKSALLESFAAAFVDVEGVVVRARCERTGIVPLQPVLEALVPFADPQVPGASAAVASLLDRVDDGDASMWPERGSRRRQRTLEAVCDLVAELADRGRLLITLDDAQWADPMTLAFIEHLVGHHRHRPIVLVLTARSSDMDDSELASLIEELRASIEPIELTVTPLDPESLLRVAGLTPDDPRADEVVAAAGGNPYFAGLLATHLAPSPGPPGSGSVPRTLERLCLSRLGDLSGSSVQLLEAASVLGIDSSVGEVAAALGEDPAQLADRLAELRAARILDPSSPEDRIVFSHGVMRQVTHDQIEPARRVQLHLSAARSIDPGSVGGTDRLAYHLARARPLAVDPEIADASLAAGRRAIELGAPLIAVEHFRTVLSLGSPSAEQRSVAELGLGIGLAIDGDLVGAASSLGDAIALALATSRWDVAADSLSARAALGIAATIPEALEMVELIDEVLASVPPDEHHRRAHLLFWKTEQLVNVDAAAADRALQAAREHARMVDDAELDGLLAYAALRQSDAACLGPVPFEEAARDLVRRMDAIDSPALVARAFLLMQSARLRLGRIAEVAAAVPPAPTTDPSLAPGIRLHLDLARVGLALAVEPLDIADDHSAMVTDRPHPGLENLAITARMLHLTVIRREQIRLHELEPLMVGALDMSPRRMLRPLVAACRGELGDVDGRAAQLSMLRRELDGLGPDWAYLSTLAFAAEVAAEADDVELGALLERRLDEHDPQVVVACSVVLVIGHIDRYRGLLAMLRGDLDAAVERFSHARRRDADSGMRLWSAWAAHGEATARSARLGTGDLEVAEELLDAAATTAILLGSRRLSVAVADALGGSRGPARRR